MIELQNEVKAEVMTLSNQASAIQIVDAESFRGAGEMGKGLKELRVKIETFFKPLKEKSYQAWKEICNAENREIAPVKAAEDIIKRGVSAYLTEQERIRKIEQERLEREEREKAEAERKRLLEQAIKAEEKGKTEKAEALLEQAEAVTETPVLAVPETKQITRLEEGSVSQKKDIEVTVIDLKLLCKAVGDGVVPITCISPEITKIKAYAKAMGYKSNEIAGVKITETVKGVWRGK